MHGRDRRASSYHALAFLALGCAYFAFAPISALAQSAGSGGKGVSVTVNPTTGYTVVNSSTVRTPRGTTVGPSGGPPSVTVRPNGGLSQSLPAGIEITGIRQNSQSLRGNLGMALNTTASVLRNSATRCLTSFRCTNALSLGAIGLQELLNTMNWELDPEGRPTEQGPYPEQPPVESSQQAAGLSYFVSIDNHPPGYTNVWSGFQPNGNPEYRACPPRTPQYLVAYNFDLNFCYYSPHSYTPDRVSVPASSVSDAVNNSYTPHPSDFPWLTGGLDFNSPGVSIDITDIPVLDGSNEPNFIEFSDGTSRGTYNIYTPTVHNNGSHQPEIEVNDQQTETNYDQQGNPTGSSTSTGTMTPNPGGSASSPDIVIPTDCDFMPTVCRFIDWFTEPDPKPDPDQEIRNLVQVYEDGGRDVTVGPDSGSCPPPRTIELSLVPSVEFSFQPFCDLATAVRFWLLAISAFAAAYMTVRSI